MVTESHIRTSSFRKVKIFGRTLSFKIKFSTKEIVVENYIFYIKIKVVI